MNDEMTAQRIRQLERDYGQACSALAAAQATIAQMRKALKAASAFVPERYMLQSIIPAALSIRTSQDALHEALARECERLASDLQDDSPDVHKWLLVEAAAHRAKKSACPECKLTGGQHKLQCVTGGCVGRVYGNPPGEEAK